MANTTLASLGPSVAVSPEGEKRMTFLGDGARKPGDCVGVLSTTKVVGTDVGAAEYFLGFLDVHQQIAADTAITDALACDVIIPQSGHRYRIHIEDPAGSEYEGAPYTFSDTVGTMEQNTAVKGSEAKLAKSVANGDTYAEIIWQ